MKKKYVMVFAVALIIILCLPVTAAAEMIDKYADPVDIVRSGSFEATDKTRMDFSLDGGTLTSAEWTVVRHGAIYTLEGTFKEGENISLGIMGTESPLPDKNSRVFNYMKMELAFVDSNYKLIGEKQTYFSEYVNDATLEYIMIGQIPSGTAEVKINGSFNCRWAGQVVVEEGVSVYVSLKAENPPTESLPTESLPTATESYPILETEPVVDSQQEDIQPSPTLIPEKAPMPEPEDEGSSDSDDPVGHAGPLVTAIISIIATIAAVLGGVAATTASGAVGASIGTGEGTDDGRDSAYERAKVPDYPEFVVGQDGERITKTPDGNIEASFPNGDVTTYFPNGTVQVKSPNGTTREEWPDGTVSTTDDGQFIVKKPDGTITIREPNGDETIYNPDGTSIETKSDGMKISKDAQGETKSAERDGFIVTRHSEDPDAKVMTSPYGGIVVIREKVKTETFKNADGKREYRTVYEPVLEGEIRSESATHIYNSDGSMECREDDGTRFKQDANGSIDASSPDGTKLNYNAETGEIDYKFRDGSYIKGNELTGEVDAKMADGSYWQRDAKGNGGFSNTIEGSKGVCREDGSFKIEVKGGTFTQNADGTMELQAEDGTSLIQRADGTQYVRKSDGTVIEPD